MHFPSLKVDFLVNCMSIAWLLYCLSWKTWISLIWAKVKLYFYCRINKLILPKKLHFLRFRLKVDFLLNCMSIAWALYCLSRQTWILLIWAKVKLYCYCRINKLILPKKLHFLRFRLKVNSLVNCMLITWALYRISRKTSIL